MEKKVTKAELTEFLRQKLSTDAAWAKAALVRIYNNQTLDERAAEETNHLNGIGFTGSDAKILTRFAEWYQTKGWLSPRQMALVFKKMGKYAVQLMHGEYFDFGKLEAAYLKANAAA